MVTRDSPGQWVVDALPAFQPWRFAICSPTLVFLPLSYLVMLKDWTPGGLDGCDPQIDRVLAVGSHGLSGVV